MRMTPMRLGLLGVALLALGFFADAWRGARVDAGPDAPHGQAAQVDDRGASGLQDMAPADGVAGMSRTSAATAALPPRPPANLPLAEAWDALVERGRAGDAVAACRLGDELRRCALAARDAATVQDLERDAARRQTTPAIVLARIEQHESRSQLAGLGCEGLTPAQLATAFDWQRQAAALDPARRMDLVLMPALDPRDFLADHARWGEYRSVALPWLEQAAQAGDPVAVIALARVYGDHRRSTFLTPPFRIRDDARFVFYAGLMDRMGLGLNVVRNAAAQARARLTPEQIAAVEAELADRAARGLPTFESGQADAAHTASLGRLAPPVECEPAAP